LLELGVDVVDVHWGHGLVRSSSHFIRYEVCAIVIRVLGKKLQGLPLQAVEVEMKGSFATDALCSQTTVVVDYR
jgi:hypothetical protein